MKDTEGRSMERKWIVIRNSQVSIQLLPRYWQRK